MKLRAPQLSKTFLCHKGENVFHYLRGQQVAVASSCKGQGICGKCVVQITHGNVNLTPPEDLELQLQQKYKLQPDQRISCQCKILNEDGEIEVRTSYW